MTYFAELCKRLQREIKEVKNNIKSIKINPYRVGLEASRGERLVRARDEVAFLRKMKNELHLCREYECDFAMWQYADDRIADLQAGIKILEGKT